MDHVLLAPAAASLSATDQGQHRRRADLVQGERHIKAQVFARIANVSLQGRQALGGGGAKLRQAEHRRQPDARVRVFQALEQARELVRVGRRGRLAISTGDSPRSSRWPARARRPRSGGWVAWRRLLSGLALARAAGGARPSNERPTGGGTIAKVERLVHPGIAAKSEEPNPENQIRTEPGSDFDLVLRISWGASFPAGAAELRLSLPSRPLDLDAGPFSPELSLLSPARLRDS